MKTLLVAVMCVLLVAIFVTGCEGKSKEELQLDRTDDIIFDLFFIKIKYPGTDLCFAVYHPGTTFSMMTAVDCEKVPAGKLTTGKIAR